MKSYIPTINISSLLDGKFISKESRKTIQEIKKACIEIGFFQVVGHGLKTKDINIPFKNINSSIQISYQFQNRINKIETRSVHCA